MRSAPPPPRPPADAGWALDLALLALLSALTLGWSLSGFGVWAPWEATLAGGVEVMAREGVWLRALPDLEGAAGGGRYLPELPFGWWPAMLSYAALPTELGLRLPSALLAALCALALYRAGRLAGGRAAGWLCALCWLALPAVQLPARLLLTHAGWLFATLAPLLLLDARRPWQLLAGYLSLAAAALSLGAVGLAAPLAAVLAVRGARAPAPAHAPAHAHAPYALLAALLVAAGAWRVTARAPSGDLGAWLDLWVWADSPFEEADPKAYKGFHVAAQGAVFALAPLSALLPVGVTRALWPAAGERARPHLAAWLGAAAAAVALNAAHHGGSPQLTPLLAAPAALLAGLYLAEAPRGPREALGALLTGALWLLVAVDLKRDPARLLSALTGQGVEGLPAPFYPWRLASIALVAWLVTYALLSAPLLDALGRLPRALGAPARRLAALSRHPAAAPALLGAAALLWAGGLARASAGFTRHLSQRDLLTSYERLARDGEPLRLYRLDPKAARASFYLKGRADTSAAEFKRLARAPERVFFAMERKHLSAVNRDFRAHTQSNLPVLDAASATHLLVSNQLRAGEESQNPIERALLKALPEGVTPLSEPVSFEGKAELVAWGFDDPALRPGAQARLRLYWRARAPLSGAWKVFVHIDAAGQRIHADHDPVEGLFPTQDWRPGDLIADEHPFLVRGGVKPDTFKVFVGLYRGETRLKISAAPAGVKASDDRALLGAVRVR